MKKWIGPLKDGYPLYSPVPPFLVAHAHVNHQHVHNTTQYLRRDMAELDINSEGLLSAEVLDVSTDIGVTIPAQGT